MAVSYLDPHYLDCNMDILLAIAFEHLTYSIQ